MKEGGRYLVKKPGDKPKRVQYTKDHPDGNAPRNSKGKRLDVEAEVKQPSDSDTAESSKKQSGSK